MNSLNTPLIKLSLVLLLGVITGFFLNFTVKAVLYIFSVALVLFIFSVLRARKILFHDTFFGVTTFFIFFSVGLCISYLHDPTHQKHHYINRISSENATATLTIQIREVLKPDLYNHKYIANLESINSKAAQGKILVLFPKDEHVPNLTVGDRFITVNSFKNIPKPLNPHQFDYRRFMEVKGILRQISLSTHNFIRLSSGKGLLAYTHQLRQKMISDLKDEGFEKDQLAVIQALLLGQKQDLSKETYNNYAAAGAIHILAVSGLHVGIILLILNFIFSPLKKLKRGRYLKLVLVILFLWFYAILAGLSPSVVRAVTMFSFIAIGMALNRRTSTLNALFLSLLVLILINPFWIFEIGFQLSYLAVLSIILIQPLIYKAWRPNLKILKYFWGLLTTTFAAQLGVLPLGLFYFHQFPGLFFISNLVILPFLAFILSFGFLIIILSGFDILPVSLSSLYGWIINTLNQFVAFIAGKERFLFKDISFDFSDVIAYYLLITCLYLLGTSFTYRKLILTLLTVIIIQSVAIMKSSFSSEDELIVFHQSRKSGIGKVQGSKMVFSGRPSSEEISPMVKNYTVGKNLDLQNGNTQKNVFVTNDQLLFLIDSTGVYPKQEVDYLVITGSPKINMERCLNATLPKKVIADGSNYPSNIQKWEKTCREKNIPFHYTGEKGAFILQ